MVGCWVTVCVAWVCAETAVGDAGATTLSRSTSITKLVLDSEWRGGVRVWMSGWLVLGDCVRCVGVCRDGSGRRWRDGTVTQLNHH